MSTSKNISKTANTSNKANKANKATKDSKKAVEAVEDNKAVEAVEDNKAVEAVEDNKAVEAVEDNKAVEAVEVQKLLTQIEDNAIKLLNFYFEKLKSFVATTDTKKAVEDIEKTYTDTCDNALKELQSHIPPTAKDVQRYTDTVTTAKEIRDTSLKAVISEWGKVTSKNYAIDKDFLLKNGFDSLETVEVSKNYNSLFTRLFNIIGCSNGIPTAFEAIKGDIEADKMQVSNIELFTKHGIYGAFKTFMATLKRYDITETPKKAKDTYNKMLE